MSKFLIGNIKGPKGDKGEQGATGPKGEQGIQGPVGPAGGVDSVNGKKGDVTIADALGYTPAGGENLLVGSGTTTRVTALSNQSARAEYTFTKEKLERNETYTVSGDIEVISGNIDELLIIPVDKNNSNASTVSEYVKVENGHFRRVFTTVLNRDGIKLFIYAGVGGSTANNDVVFSHVKLEPGLVTDPIWTPAPEDVLLKGEVDGRNLFVMANCIGGYVADNGSVYNSSEYYIRTDYIPVDNAQQFVMQQWGKPLSIIPTNGASLLVSICYFDEDKKFIKKTIADKTSLNDTYISLISDVPENAYYYIAFTRRNDGVTDNKIKVERGSTPTPWTPAPEDVVVRSELEELIKRVTALETQTGITSVDSFMELPSADVMESGSETASADEVTDDTEIN